MENKENIATKENPEIEKLKLVLELAGKEANVQDSRKQGIDLKIICMLSIVVVLLGMLILKFNASNLFVQNFFSRGVFEVIYRFTFLALYIANVVLCIISIFFFTNCLINKNTAKTNIELLHTDFSDEYSYFSLVRTYIKNYNEISKKNSDLNDFLLKRYKAGSILFLISTIMTVVIWVMTWAL